MTDLIVRNIDRLSYLESASILDMIARYDLNTEIRQYALEDLLTKAIFLTIGYSLDQLKEGSRKSELVYARWIFFYHIRRLHPHYTYTEIGALLGRSRSTVESNLKRFKEQNNAFNPLLHNYAKRVELYLKEQ
jgi:chromosomal replication initiation ATPase DnaA